MSAYKALKNNKGFHLIFRYNKYDIICTNSSYMKMEECLYCNTLTDNHSAIDCLNMEENKTTLNRRSAYMYRHNRGGTAPSLHNLDTNNVVDIDDIDYIGDL